MCTTIRGQFYLVIIFKVLFPFYRFILSFVQHFSLLKKNIVVPSVLNKDSRSIFLNCPKTNQNFECVDVSFDQTNHTCSTSVHIRRAESTAQNRVQFANSSAV